MNLMKLLTLCCLAVTISMSENFCQTKLLDNIAEQPDYAARPYILRLNGNDPFLNQTFSNSIA